jgi:hypothetical protein
MNDPERVAFDFSLPPGAKIAMFHVKHCAFMRSRGIGTTSRPSMKDAMFHVKH